MKRKKHDMPYCVCAVDKPLGHKVAVPLVQKGKYEFRYFPKADYPNSLEAALKWRDERGIQEWGWNLWQRILFNKNVRKFRSMLKGVCCYLGLSDQKYPIWIVEWGTEDFRFTKCFGAKRYGSIENAELAAHDFATRKRAELLGMRTISTRQFEFDDV